jgi:hypothetical protein
MQLEDDALIPDPEMWRKFGVSPMTGWRWTNDPKLNFPQPIKIRTRNFRRGGELNEFGERLLREAIKQRAEKQKGGAA